MKRYNQISEQRLLQASADLSNQLAEIQKLKDSVLAAEAQSRLHSEGHQQR